MRLTVIRSGSKGNCYVLHGGSEALMIEAGVPFSEVIGAVGPEVAGSIRTCLLTHEHQDHAKYATDVLDHGIRLWATSGTIGALKGRTSRVLKPSNFRLDQRSDDRDVPWEPLRTGGFLVLPFRTVHDAASPCGFIIRHADFGTMLFATDTKYVPAGCSGLSNILIECNYEDGLLDRRTDIPASLKERIRRSHQSLINCEYSLGAVCSGQTVMVMLIHISEGDGDPVLFRDHIQRAVGPGTRVEVAESGRTYELARAPF